jgi:hypothetical protein
MPKWHWIYRDFVANVTSPSQGWHQSFERYLHSNWNLLKDIHFLPKGYGEDKLVSERFRTLSTDQYAALFDVLQDQTAFESTVIDTLDQILRLLSYPANHQDVYVIVGLDCTNIYATNYEDRPVTVLCLEATKGDLKELELLLAHEAHHWKRQSMLSHDIFEKSVCGRCISEGMAICFSEEVQPGRALHDYCFVPPETVAWVQSHLGDIDEVIQRGVLFETDIMSALFSRHPKKTPLPEMPPRTGYVYGYLRTKTFLSGIQATAAEMAHVGCEAVFGGIDR